MFQEELPSVTIMTLLDTSIGHVRSTDNELLGRYTAREGHPTGASLIAYPYEYGWTVMTSVVDPRSGDLEERLAAIKAEGFSDEFVALLRHAQEQGTVMLRLDRDGEELEDFPLFDWEKGDELVESFNVMPAP